MIGAKIRAARQARNWTQAELAEASGISLNYIKQLEGGHKPNPTQDTLQKLARAFGISLDELVEPAQDDPFPAANLREWGVSEADLAQFARAWPYWSRRQRIKFLGDLRTIRLLQADVQAMTEEVQEKVRALENRAGQEDDPNDAAPTLAPQIAV